MTEAGADDPGLVGAIFVHPGNRRSCFGRFCIGIRLLAFFDPGFLNLEAICQNLGSFKNLNVVVKLFVDGGPILESLRDGVR